VTTARFLAERAHAERHPCPYCDAPAGTRCLNSKTDQPLECQPAHWSRRLLAVETADEEPK
jgi:hypothetical protein